MTTAEDIFGGVDLSGFGDADITFTECKFGQNPQYIVKDKKSGEDYMPTVFMTDMVNADGETRENQNFSLGNGFAMKDGGARVEHGTARHNREHGGGFGKGSKFQEFLDKCLEIAHDQMIGRWEETGKGPRDAEFWEGLCFHGVEEERSFGKDGKYRILLPTKVYGWGELGDFVDEAGGEVEQQPAKKAAAKKAPAIPAAQKKTPPKRVKEEVPAANEVAADVPTNTWGLDEDVFQELTALALANRESFDTFMDAAYLTDAINDDAVQAVVDNGDAADGFWTVVTAGGV